MRRIFWLLPLLAACSAQAQEFSLFAGGLKDSSSKESTYSWAMEYQQGIGENLAASFSWLNEGHVTGHHRDGQSIQLWARTNVWDRRLSLSAGIGPYRYFDTTVSSAGGGYANIHGWATNLSLGATYYTNTRWLFQLRANRIIARDSIDTSSLMMGIGYQLEPQSRRGPSDSVPSQFENTSKNEIAVFLGQTVVNSFRSERDSSRAIEYRRGIAKYADITVGLLNEGDPRLIRRTGATAQIWAVREFLASDRLVLGIGIGPYYALDRYRTPLPGEGGQDRLSGIFTAMAGFRFGRHWDARLSWNRTITSYNRDTDIVMLGAGYRF